MSFLPQELLDAIVNEVHDMETLKNCPLAGYTLREPRRQNYAAACKLLEESPHIAHYITRL
ncbi:hypothetical protein B0H13DRAFT_2346940 [Mycena leptocephala]|nr:hypothetical protein B0H13DRAFT_2346940 [Mycena leptocephala]